MKTNHLFTVNFALVLFASTNLFAQTETRNVSAFDGIHVAGHYDVTLTKGTEGTLTLEGDQEDLDRIKTHVKNGNLVIEQMKTSWLESWNSGQVKIHIPVEAISKISLSGSGSIYSRNELNSKEFDITLSGSGEIDLNLNAQDINAVLRVLETSNYEVKRAMFLINLPDRETLNLLLLKPFMVMQKLPAQEI